MKWVCLYCSCIRWHPPYLTDELGLGLFDGDTESNLLSTFPKHALKEESNNLFSWAHFVFLISETRQTMKSGLLCGRITAGELWTHSSNHQAAPGFWAFSVSWQTQRSHVLKTVTVLQKERRLELHSASFRSVLSTEWSALLPLAASHCQSYIILFFFQLPLGFATVDRLTLSQPILASSFTTSMNPPWGLHLFLLLGSSIFILYAPSSPSSARVQNISAFPV